MRMSVIQSEGNKTIYYNTGVFRKHEDLIMFPYWEFEATYNELIDIIKILRNVMKLGVNGEQGYTPEDALVHGEHYVQEARKILDNLTEYDVQTTLEGYAGSRETKKRRQLLKENETPQYLLGL